MKEFEAGVEIADFRIIRRLGSGGMGVVYLAQQISLDRPVALKVLGAALTHPQDILRFQREAQAAAKLHHPNIAVIYFIGQDQLGCYMAMEYIDGVSLRELVNELGVSQDAQASIKTVLHRETLKKSQAPRVRYDEANTQVATDSVVPAVMAHTRMALEAITPQAGRLIASRDYVRQVCEMMRDAALALDHAHQQGVVHRDIKPQNIMMDRKGGLKVIDFGVARFFDDATITQQGQLVGTPMYMSPEQVAGHAVDGRSDIYSLGLVMYELLTLRRPLLAPTREAILRGVVTKAMVPVGWKNEGVPRSVESVVHTALAKDPDDRYASAAELADDLQRCLDEQPVVARPYRYKFDTREIVAERPWTIMAVAMFWFFTAFYFLMIVWPSKFVNYYLYGSGWAAAFWASLLPIGAAALCTCLGFGLKSGRTWSRWMAILAAFLVIGYSVRELTMTPSFQVLFYDQPLSRRFRLFATTTGWIMPLLITIVGGLCALVVLLQNRQWFQFASQIRMEHRDLLTTVRSGTTESHNTEGPPSRR